jgi:RNA polymerase sigma factor (sigma-70 family)
LPGPGHIEDDPFITKHPQDELSKLIQDCISWNQPSQRIFYETYAPALYQVIKRSVFDDHTAQEILNDSFYKILTSLKQYAWQGPIEAWMRRITVNTVIDYLRKHLKRELHMRTELKDEAIYIDNEAISNLSFSELVTCLGKLTTLQRSVFNLFVFENLSHLEIGLALSISEGNSRWILNDARKKLKQIINSMK